MIHIKKEGQPIKQGINIYHWKNKCSIGGAILIGKYYFWVRYSKVTKKIGFEFNKKITFSDSLKTAKPFDLENNKFHSIVIFYDNKKRKTIIVGLNNFDKSIIKKLNVYMYSGDKISFEGLIHVCNNYYDGNYTEIYPETGKKFTTEDGIIFSQIDN
jgi:hypothetical protein